MRLVLNYLSLNYKSLKRLTYLCMERIDNIKGGRVIILFFFMFIWFTSLAYRPSSLGIFHVNIQILYSFILVTLLGILVITDFFLMLLPARICNFGLILGLTLTGLIPFILDQDKGIYIFLDHLLAPPISLFFMNRLRILSNSLFKLEVLGNGDSKFISMGASWLGIHGITTATGIAFIVAGALSLLGRLSEYLKPLQPIPFGPFIAIGIWGVWLMGSSWWFLQWNTLWGH